MAIIPNSPMRLRISWVNVVVVVVAVAVVVVVVVVVGCTYISLTDPR